MPIYTNDEYIRIVRPLPAFVKRDIYSIPFIIKQEIDFTRLRNGMSLINLNNISSSDKAASRKIVHSFSYDRILIRYFNNPQRFLHKVSGYYAVSSFDFSITPGMDFKQVLSAVYDNRWIGAYLQANGKRVIATVGWTEPNYYDICFAGLEDGASFIISTIGVHNTDSHQLFIDGYRELRNRFPSSKLICLGDKVIDMGSDVCYVPYEESFGNADRYSKYWQPSFVNWDLSLAQGGDY